jgi:WXG100 family type VII secretion target
MGKILRVTPEQLETASKKLAGLSGSYTDIYKQLLQQAGTMGASWEGADNLAFVDQINGFCQDLSDMAQKLQTASDALHRQKTNYATRQENNITQVKKLAN